MATLSQIKAPPKTKNPAPRAAPPPKPKAEAAPPAYLQAKLNLSHPGDSYEREANQVADRVMREPLQRNEEAVQTASEQVQTDTLRPGMTTLGEAEQAQRVARSSLSPGEDEVRLTEEPMQRQAESACRQTDETAQRSDEPDVQAQEESACRTADPLQRQDESVDRVDEPIAQTQAEQACRTPEPMQRQAETISRTEQPTVQAQADQACRSTDEIQRQEEPAAHGDGAEQEGAAATVANGKVPPEIEARIQAARGGGEPLPEELRNRMEQRLGADFSAVRVHTDAEADELAITLRARAFTVGNDIFFAAGRFDPEGAAGQRLLAHELTHVVQQSRGVQTSVQREDDDSTPPTTAGDRSLGEVNTQNHTITYNSIAIPAFKTQAHRGELYSGWGDLKRSHRYSSNRVRPGNQQDIWKNNIGVDGIIAVLQGKVEEPRPAEDQYVFRGPRRPGTQGGHHARRGYEYYIGTLRNIAREVSAPYWNLRGSRTASMEVDHIVELQLSGFPDTQNAHRIANMELLERRPNSLSGGAVDRSINAKVGRTVGNAAIRPLLEHDISGFAGKTNAQKVSAVRERYDLVFKGYEAGSGPSINENSFWSRTQVEAGEHLRPIEVANIADLDQEGNVMVFPKSTGGLGRRFAWNGSNRNPTGEERVWLSPWIITEKEFFTNPESRNEALVGNFHIELPRNEMSRPIARDIIGIKRMGNNLAVGSPEFDKEQVRFFGRYAVKHLSPVEIDSVDFSPGGMRATGRVVPSIPVIEGAYLDFAVENGEARMFRAFSTGDFNLPSPLEVHDCSLTVGASSRDGFFTEGLVSFGIQNVGDGRLGAGFSTESGFKLEGAFDFDSRMFDPAIVCFTYENQQFSAEGTLGIPEGKVRGIKSAEIAVGYSESTISASGEAELDIPGVERGTLEVRYSEENGFSIGGTFDLSSDVPGIRGGSVAVTLEQREDGEGYKVSATGEAQPDIPGIDSTLSVEYDDGAIAITGSARYQRGMLDGSVNVGVTNRALDDQGQPTGEPEEQLKVHGGGSLSLQIAPWLQATAGVKFAPDGEITVCGEVGLPSELEIFPRKEIEKRIFSLSFPIPIVPGLSAEIGGSLSANAGIGPGVIDELRLGVVYTPSAEENTRVTGDAHLNIPADAGLRLAVRAGLAVGIPGVGVSGGLELGGTLGLEGAAEAGVHLEWMPSEGLSIDAYGRIYVQPKFVFDISGYVEAKALFFTLYENRWELASFEYGSNLRFGICFPVHYREGEPFDISLEDVVFEVPDVNPSEILGDLIDRIA